MEKLAAPVPRPTAEQQFELTPTDHEHEHEEPSPTKMSWARLLKRVFNIDTEVCQSCEGKVKVISAIEVPIVIRKILSHLGLDTKPPPTFPARGPPSSQLNEYSQAFPLDD